MVPRVAPAALAILALVATLTPPGGAVPPLHCQGGEICEKVPSAGPGAPVNYLLYKPANYAGTAQSPTPMVVVLHGNGGTSEAARDLTEFNALADQKGFIVLYVQALDEAPNYSRTWPFEQAAQWVRGSAVAQGILDMIQRVDSFHVTNNSIHLDEAKVYLTGYSGGGHMTSILAALYPEKFRAAGPSMAFEYKGSTNIPDGVDPDTTSLDAAIELQDAGELTYDNRIPMISFHGKNDYVILSPLPHSRALGKQFTNLNDLLLNPHCVPGGPAACDDDIDSAWDTCEQVNYTRGGVDVEYRRYTYLDHTGAVIAERWVVKDMGHQWSGSDTTSPTMSGFAYPWGPEQTAKMWDFFTLGHTDPLPSPPYCAEY